jgi:site-specific recombinase XerC
MLQLPNGCSCSEPSVFPKNWKSTSASVKKSWYIQYYFHDPAYKTKYKNGCLKIIKNNINRFKTAAERREAIQITLDELLMMLQYEGYNPITDKTIKPVESNNTIHPNTRFIDAFNQVLPKLKVVASTRADIKCVIKALSEAARQLHISALAIGEFRRKHIKSLLEQMRIINPKFSNDRYNKFRSYLMILFSELVELEAIEINPMHDLKKLSVTKDNMRDVLTDTERAAIDIHLKKKTYEFWRLTQIFFHSGIRETEIVTIQRKHIDLTAQKYKLLVKKGKQWSWQPRTIKDSALELWTELLENAEPDDFVFSKGLKPGPTQIRSDQITKRWYRHVKAAKEKGGLGIKADFYSLKHSNLDGIAQELNIEDAAGMAGHTTPVITIKHYAYGEKKREEERQHERLKKVGNKFA